jgi:hypothetical protein
MELYDKPAGWAPVHKVDEPPYRADEMRWHCQPMQLPLISQCLALHANGSNISPSCSAVDNNV